MTSETHKKQRWTDSAVARLLSFGLATLSALWVLFRPADFAFLAHGSLSIFMIGMAAGFVHGIGFKPDHLFWQWLFSAWVAWLIPGSTILLAAYNM